jgi:hypothetical protein
MARAYLPAFGVLALVGIVAIAATGSTASGSNTGQVPAEWVLDTILTLGLIALIPAAAILIYGLTQRKDIGREWAAMKRFRRLTYTAFAIFMVLLTLAVYFRLRNWKSPEVVPPLEPGFQNEPPGSPPPGGAERIYDAEFAWIPLFVVIGLAAVAAVAFLIAARRGKSARDENETIRAALATALDDSLDDLRAETDPRRAVIAAYARLERVLAAHGFPRDASETPDELLARILPSLDVDRHSIRRLTDLFTWAKFSQHDVDADMKDEAISALAQVRDELRARDEAATPVAPLRVDTGGGGRTA